MTLTIWFDGQCAVCAFEMANLALRDPAGKLQLIDYTAADWDEAQFCAAYPDKTRADLHHALRARTDDGRWLTGVDSIVAAYAAVGWGALWRPTRWPVMRPIFDWLYVRFANNRSWLTRPLKPWLDPKTAHARRMHEQMLACKAGVCELEKAS
jgi:predicted DCC family thiol-disulfide oxidoreductase YuxK